jgi:hypothetical protein
MRDMIVAQLADTQGETGAFVWANDLRDKVRELIGPRLRPMVKVRKNQKRIYDRDSVEWALETFQNVVIEDQKASIGDKAALTLADGWHVEALLNSNRSFG